jgi:hypothetical protein
MPGIGSHRLSRDGRLEKNSSRVDLSLVGNLTVCDNPSSSSICRSVWLISFRYLLPLNVFVIQSMSGRLKSPATHMLDLGYFRHNDYMVLYRALA